MRLLLPARTYIALVLLASLIGLPIQGAAMAASMSPSAIADMSSKAGFGLLIYFIARAKTQQDASDGTSPNASVIPA